MTSQMLSWREPRNQVGLPRPAVAELGVSRGTQGDVQGIVRELAAAPAEADEALVADARADLSPAQVVDQRVLALLQSSHPGRVGPVDSRLQGIRRIPRMR